MSLPENGVSVKGVDAETETEIRELIRDVRDEFRAIRDELRGQRDPDQLLTTEDVANILNISVRTVDTLRASGELPSLKFRGLRRYKRDAVSAFVRSQADET